MSIPGPSSSSGHRRGNLQRTRENQFPRTFLQARGGLGDAPTATSHDEDDMQPRRVRKKRSRGPYNPNAASHAGPGPSDHANSEVDKPLPRPPSKNKQAQQAQAAAARANESLRARNTSRYVKAPRLPPVTFVAETDEEGYESQSTLGGRTSAATSELSKLQAQILELKKVCQVFTLRDHARA